MICGVVTAIAIINPVVCPDQKHLRIDLGRLGAYFFLDGWIMNTESCFFECLNVLSVMLNGGGVGKVPFDGILYQLFNSCCAKKRESPKFFRIFFRILWIVFVVTKHK